MQCEIEIFRNKMPQAQFSFHRRSKLAARSKLRLIWQTNVLEPMWSDTSLSNPSREYSYSVNRKSLHKIGDTFFPALIKPRFSLLVAHFYNFFVFLCLRTFWQIATTICFYFSSVNKIISIFTRKSDWNVFMLTK